LAQKDAKVSSIGMTDPQLNPSEHHGYLRCTFDVHVPLETPLPEIHISIPDPMNECKLVGRTLNYENEIEVFTFSVHARAGALIRFKTELESRTIELPE
jgi:hypothetical protein